MMQKSVNKRGQVTIFIILGIIIVAGIVGFFMLSPNSPFSNSNAKFPEINSLMEDCIEETTLEAIYFNSLQGGYYNNVPSPKLNIDFLEVPVYFNKGQKNPISKEKLEEQLENYIKDSLYCTEYLEQSDKEVSEDGLKEVKVLISDKVNVKIDYPINIKEEDSSVRLTSFTKDVSFDIEKKLEDLNSFLELQSKDSESILFTEMEILAEERGFKIEFFGLANTTENSYNFVYEQNKLNNRTYVFSFGVIY